MLALVRDDRINTFHAHDSPRAILVPARRVRGVLVEDVAASLDLHGVQIHGKPEMDPGPGHDFIVFLFVPSRLVYGLPLREGRAHRRPDQEKRPFLLQHLFGFGSLFWNVKVPRVAILVRRREVEGHARDDAEVWEELGHGRDPRWAVYLGDYRLHFLRRLPSVLPRITAQRRHQFLNGLHVLRCFLHHAHRLLLFLQRHRHMLPPPGLRFLRRPCLHLHLTRRPIRLAILRRVRLQLSRDLPRRLRYSAEVNDLLD